MVMELHIEGTPSVILAEKHAGLLVELGLCTKAIHVGRCTGLAAEERVFEHYQIDLQAAPAST